MSGGEGNTRGDPSSMPRKEPNRRMITVFEAREGGGERAKMRGKGGLRRRAGKGKNFVG